MPRRRLRRFEHLERRRPDRGGAPDAAPAAPGPTPGRFEGVERPGAGAGPAARSGAALERFGPGVSELALAERDADRLPFLRCERCGADSNRFASTCGGCGAPLDTDAQRAFNAELLAERRAQAAAEASGAAALADARARAEADEARARRAVAEGLAREVGEAERRRLERDGLGGGLTLADLLRLFRRLRGR